MLYRVLKVTVNLVIILGVLLTLYGLGGSINQSYANLIALQAAGRLDGVVDVPAPLRAALGLDPSAGSAVTDLSERQVGLERQPGQLPTQPPPDRSPVDMEAWVEFDFSVFDDDSEGFLPYNIAAGSDLLAPTIEAEQASVALTENHVYLPLIQSEMLDDSSQEEPPGADAYPAPVIEEPEVETIVEAEPEPPRAPTRIVIPSINLDAPIVAVFPKTINYSGMRFEQWQAPAQFAAGWHESSAWLGESGNTVLNGHHNIYEMVFGQLLHLERYDEVIVYGEEKGYHYTVSQVMIFEERGASVNQRAQNASWILPSDDERLTLVTCWPPENNTHRLIVVATRQK
jgi:LPXTG-site transpeptidase (sortase) family protein